MREQEPQKNVPIYFYYLSISKHKDAKDDSTYSMDQIIGAFSQLLEYTMTKGLPERKKDIISSEKVVWLETSGWRRRKDTSMHSPCKRRKQVSCSSRKQSLWYNPKVHY